MKGWLFPALSMVGIVALAAALGAMLVLGAWLGRNSSLTPEQVERVLGERECMVVEVLVPDPLYGLVKIGKQSLCGYHFEWSSVKGGKEI